MGQRVAGGLAVYTRWPPVGEPRYTALRRLDGRAGQMTVGRLWPQKGSGAASPYNQNTSITHEYEYAGLMV